MSDWDRLVNAARNGLAREGSAMVGEALGNMGSLTRPTDTLIANPAWDDADDEDVDDDDEDDGVETDGIAFEYDDASENIASAAGAYRFLGGDGDIVAHHRKTGRAFFGCKDEFQEYRENNDLRDGWKVYRTEREILGLEYDQDTIRDLVREMDKQSIEEAREMFEGFHWGDDAGTVVMKDIDGIEGPLTVLGVAREIHYYAVKDGKPVEYFHEFGEESGTFPTLYARGDRVLVVHGGAMRIEDRGVVD